MYSVPRYDIYSVQTSSVVEEILDCDLVIYTYR